MENIIGPAIVLAAAILVWYLLRTLAIKRLVKEAESKSEKLLSSAKKDSENLKKEKLLEARDDIYKWKVEAENAVQLQRKKIDEFERGLVEKAHRLKRDAKRTERRRRDIEEKTEFLRCREKEIESRQQEVDELLQDQVQQLEKVAEMTVEELVGEDPCGFLN